jgi:hypothetical protein
MEKDKMKCFICNRILGERKPEVSRIVSLTLLICMHKQGNITKNGTCGKMILVQHTEM